MDNLLEKVVTNYSNLVLFIVSDTNNQIIMPTDLEKLSLYRKILMCQNNGTEFFDKENNIWYSYSRIMGKDGYIYEYFTDITMYKEREQKLEIDYTTNLYNKGVSNKMLNEYIKFAIDKNEEFAVIMGDIDFFKNVNDNYGHLVGDAVLKEIANTILSNVKINQSYKTNDSISGQDKKLFADVVGRFGGEEFLIVLKNVNNVSAMEKIENLRKAIVAIKMISNEGYNRTTVLSNLSMSFGVYHVNQTEIDVIKKEINEETDVGFDDYRSSFIRKADIALHMSKKNGRNTVTLYNSIFSKKKKRLVK